LVCALFEFSYHRGETRFFSSGGISVNNPLGTRLIQCFDRIAEQPVSILNIARHDRFHDIFATVPKERPSGTISIAGGNVLTKPLFGTGNIRHKILIDTSNNTPGNSTLFSAKDKGDLHG
jgi:hypothetical protein